MTDKLEAFGFKLQMPTEPFWTNVGPAEATGILVMLCIIALLLYKGFGGDD
jgi:hypothetical protein